VAPEHVTGATREHPFRKIVERTREVFPELIDFADYYTLESLVTKTGVDNSKKFIAKKIQTSVFNHVVIHLYIRMKGSMESRRLDEKSDVDSMKKLFVTGEDDGKVAETDRAMVRSLRYECFLNEKPEASRERGTQDEAKKREKHAEKLKKCTDNANSVKELPPLDATKPSKGVFSLHLNIAEPALVGAKENFLLCQIHRCVVIISVSIVASFSVFSG
jgi:hypothetical protein